MKPVMHESDNDKCVTKPPATEDSTYQSNATHATAGQVHLRANSVQLGRYFKSDLLVEKIGFCWSLCQTEALQQFKPGIAAIARPAGLTCRIVSCWES